MNKVATKFCVDCKFFKRMSGPGNLDLCTRFFEISVVDGKKVYNNTCVGQRVGNIGCGVNGTLFVPKSGWFISVLMWLTTKFSL